MSISSPGGAVVTGASSGFGRWSPDGWPSVAMLLWC
jgi:hypothetical protein